MKLCACGCGQEINSKKHFVRFIWGHHQNKENNHQWKGGVYTKEGIRAWDKRRRLCNPQKTRYKDAKRSAQKWFERNTGYKGSLCPKEVVEMRINLNKTLKTIKKEQ